MAILHNAAYFFLGVVGLLLLFMALGFVYFLFQELTAPPTKYQRHRQQQEIKQRAHTEQLEEYYLQRVKAERREWEEKEGVLPAPFVIVLFVVLFLFGWGLSNV